jgi:hypothetical protein
MELIITPSQDKKRLAENLERHVEKIEIKDEKLVIETDKKDIIERTPGVEKFEIDGEKEPGLKGKPVQKEAYAKVESKEDAVKALIATTEGYDLRVLNSNRDWDMRNLKKYNPDMKHLKSNSPKKILGIEKTISDLEDSEGIEKVNIEMPEDREKLELIYREMLT